MRISFSLHPPKLVKLKKTFNTLYAFGEAQYSGKILRVTVFYTFLSRVDYNLMLNMAKLCNRSNYS